MCQHQPRAIRSRFNLRASHGQFHHQLTARRTGRRPLHDEILAHTVHAHGVFLRQPGAAETRRLAPDGYFARIRQWAVGFWN